MRKYIITLAFLGVLLLSLTQVSCTVTEKIPASIQEKTGAQLWGENCSRCHNAPGPGQFSDPSWEIIGLHMRTRANLTETETNKIIAFLQDGNVIN